jgi:hypothetical protein
MLGPQFRRFFDRPLKIIMRLNENRSTMMTSNRPIEEWGKLLSDVPAAGATKHKVTGQLLENFPKQSTRCQNNSNRFKGKKVAGFKSTADTADRSRSLRESSFDHSWSTQFQTVTRSIKSPRSARSFLVGVGPVKDPRLYP